MPKDKTKTHSALLTAAKREFLEKGFEKAALNVIAEGARALFGYDSKKGLGISAFIMSFSTFAWAFPIWFMHDFTISEAVKEMPAGYAETLDAVSPMWTLPVVLLGALLVGTGCIWFYLKKRKRSNDESLGPGHIMAGPTSVIVTLSFRGRGSRRAWEKTTFPCPRTPTPSGFLAEFTLKVEISVLVLVLFEMVHSMLTLNITQYAFSVRDFSVFIFCFFDA